MRETQLKTEFGQTTGFVCTGGKTAGEVRREPSIWTIFFRQQTIIRIVGYQPAPKEKQPSPLLTLSSFPCLRLAEYLGRQQADLYRDVDCMFLKLTFKKRHKFSILQGGRRGKDIVVQPTKTAYD